MKPQNSALLTYALNRKGELVHVDSVPNGNGCGCICPYCKSELCAKNGGEQKIHHFAHLSGADCAGGFESALHIMAKNILKEVKCVRLPAIEDVCESELLHLDEVNIEVYDNSTSLRPDCIGYYGEKIIWIEFKRTHAVDKKKKGKIISKQIDCIEIDLNGCELAPEKVKDLLVNIEDKRIWIFNSEHKYSFSKKVATNNKERQDSEECVYGKHRIVRTFAISDDDKIVQLDNLSEIDMNEHLYFCPACKKEVVIDVTSNGGYFFKHIDSIDKCADKYYLVETAKAILHGNFKSSAEFNISVSQTHICCHHMKCKLYSEIECYTSKPQVFNIKHWGYDGCEIDKILPDSNIKVHLFFSIRGNDNGAIGIIIKSEDDDSSISIPFRWIEIEIANEDDLYKLKHNNLENYSRCKFYNFNHKTFFDGDDAVQVIPMFILYSSGKSYVKDVACRDELKQRDSAIKMLFFANVDGSDMQFDDAMTLGLLHCHQKGIKGCYCKLCSFLKRTMFDDLICIRYKTKGTPKYPLQESKPPIDCQWFRLDSEKVDSFAEEYKDVEMVEIDNIFSS